MGPLEFFGVLLKNYFPPASQFDVERDIPDLTGRVIIVTGTFRAICWKQNTGSRLYRWEHGHR